MPPAKVDEEAVESPTEANSMGGQQKNVSTAAKLRNPLDGMTDKEVLHDVDKFVDAKGLQDWRESFHKGALAARVQHRDFAFENIKMLNEEDKNYLGMEIKNKWKQPKMLYFLSTLCAGSAIVQGYVPFLFSSLPYSAHD